MKKVIFSLVALCVGMCAMAQSSIYVHEKGGKCTAYLIENLDSISFSKGITTGTENGHTWVDLGLSVKWATMNVGATSLEEPGNYYAWGEIITKDKYDWSNHTHAGSYDALTKYCNNSSYGAVDNKTTLEAADDAATQIWGGKWRMPTIEEWEELINNCTLTRTDNYENTGKCGYIVEGKNGNSIFIPATGFLEENSKYGESSCYYWSSSLGVSDPHKAQDVELKTNGCSKNEHDRVYGCPVRPVLSK